MAAISRMGVTFIQGLQGEDGDHAQCDATAKLFAVHTGPEALRRTFDAVLSRKDMKLTYLPAFRTEVEEAHVHTFMGAYNRVDGEAACASPTLLEKTPREEWGFDGYVVKKEGWEVPREGRRPLIWWILPPSGRWQIASTAWACWC